MEELKVVRAQLHQPIDLKGVVSKKTLSNHDMKGAEFSYSILGLTVKFKGCIFLIPSANVAAVVLQDES
jgi:hypothetical protein